MPAIKFKAGDLVVVAKTGKQTKVEQVTNIVPPIWCKDGSGYFPAELKPAKQPSKPKAAKAEAMVSYAHKADPKGPRFVQFKKNALPSWAVNVKPHVEPKPRPEGKEALAALLKAARAVVGNADDTGCDGDLTVTSKSAVESLEEAIRGFGP